MPGVLEVSTLQLGHPVRLWVLMEAGDVTFHERPAKVMLATYSGQGCQAPQRLQTAGIHPQLPELSLVQRRPLGHKAHGTRWKVAGNDGKAFNGDSNLVLGVLGVEVRGRVQISGMGHD